MAKTVYIASIHHGRTTIYAGTMAELVENVFGYTLECGNSWNHKIPTNPKSTKSLVSALNRSAEECRRYYDAYREATESEIEEYKNTHKAA